MESVQTLYTLIIFKWYFILKIYVKQPEGFVKNEEKDNIYLLKKALHRLKQVPRIWYSIIDDYLLSNDFRKNLSKVTLYVKHWDNNVLMVSLYVDDLF